MDTVTVAATGSRKWWALGAVVLSVLAVSLDGTVLSVALPTLSGALHATESDLEWFSAGYLLLLAAADLPAGLVGDRYGRRRVLLASLALFGAGSALCAYAPTPTAFLLARLVMGVAGSGVMVMALSALTVLFTAEERPRAVGVYEAANFVALPLGPILGGWMLSRLWWGWVFLLNVPVVVVGLLVVAVLVPESRSGDRRALDGVGVATSTAGLVALTYGLIEAGSRGWSDAVAAGAMAAGVLTLGGFAVWERRLARRGGQPLVDPALFASRSFTGGAALGGVAGLGIVGLLFAMPQYFQAVRGVDTLGSGLRLLPLVVGLVVGAVPAGRLVEAVGAKLTVAVGFAVTALGAGIGAATMTGSGPSGWVVAGWMAVLSAGVGLVLTAATAAALSRLSAERSGIGSAVVQAFQKTGGPVGTAVLGSVVAAAYTAHLDLSGLTATDAAAVRHGVQGGIATADRLGSPPLAHQVQTAYVHGVSMALLVFTAIAAAGIILTVLLLPHAAGRHDAAPPTREAVHASPPRPRPADPAGVARTEEGEDPRRHPGPRAPADP